LLQSRDLPMFPGCLIALDLCNPITPDRSFRCVDPVRCDVIERFNGLVRAVVDNRFRSGAATKRKTLLSCYKFVNLTGRSAIMENYIRNLQAKYSNM
jgi:hypothetical protein